MKVHIVAHGDISAWILGKFASKLTEELQRLDVSVSFGDACDPESDVNHHIVHYEEDPSPGTVETRMVTHLDSLDKLQVLKRQLNNGSIGVCMSREAVRTLTETGIQRGSLCFINPAHDGVWRQRPAIVGMASRIHHDGRKRERWLETLGKNIDPAEFRFWFMGEGWKRQVRILRDLGFGVEHVDHFDYAAYLETLPTLDYYLYTGMDEGQMGWIDAVAAGVKTIVTAQGYHLDAPHAITHPFITYAELEAIFLAIQAARNNYRGQVAEWTWARYAKQHLVLWQYLLCRRAGKPFIAPRPPTHDGVFSMEEFDQTRPNQTTRRTFHTLTLARGYLRRRLTMALRSRGW